MSQGVSTINLDLRCASFVMLLPFQPFPHHLDILRRDVQQHAVLLEFPGCQTRRARPCERVENDIPRSAGCPDAATGPLWQTFIVVTDDNILAAVVTLGRQG
jgi:hypothetical protein